MAVILKNVTLSYEAVKKYLSFGSRCSIVLCQQHLSSPLFKNFSHSWCEYSVQICEVIKQKRDTHASDGISAYFANNICKTE